MDESMPAFYGSYPMTRESSGTACVPDSTPMEGIHSQLSGWATMLHGSADFIYDDQGGKRGDTQFFSESMIMATASRPLGPGTFGLRGMGSLDPLMGRNGYPLLLQSGETPDGMRPLIDRQHPHDLFMELAATYSLPVGKDSSVFGYVGYPGEPALGPTTFMHRFSGMMNPEAPIDHHWLDSTHITYGVATAGAVWKDWKLEASLFNGREPDQSRYNFDHARFDSQSVRLSYNPSANWALQMSEGWINSPEQLEPDTDQRRTTASATYNLPFGGNNWQTTLAWGENDNHPGPTLDAWLLESAVKFHETHTLFARAERAEKNELFEAPDTRAGETFRVNKLSAGYLYEQPVAEHLKLGVGGVGSVYALPNKLDSAYGSTPVSFMLFTRVALD